MMPADVHHPRIRYLSSPPPSPEGTSIKAADDSFSSSARPNLFFADSSQPFVDHEVPGMFDSLDYHSYDDHRQRQWHPAFDVLMNDESSKLSDAITTGSKSWYLPDEDVDSDTTFWDSSKV